MRVVRVITRASPCRRSAPYRAQKSWEEVARPSARNKHARVSDPEIEWKAASGFPDPAGKNPSTIREDAFFMSNFGYARLPNAAAHGASQKSEQEQDREDAACQSGGS